MKYLQLTTLEVEKAITKSFSDRFALLLDGWTRHSTQFRQFLLLSWRTLNQIQFY